MQIAPAHVVIAHPLVARPLTPLAVAIVALALATGAALPASAAAPTGTLKERLSDKASDNQRVDNCRVPVERRGPKPRPDCKLPARVKAPAKAGNPGGT